MTRSSNILFCQLGKTPTDLHINYILGLLFHGIIKGILWTKKGGLFFLGCHCWQAILLRLLWPSSRRAICKLGLGLTPRGFEPPISVLERSHHLAPGRTVPVSCLKHHGNHLMLGSCGTTFQHHTGVICCPSFSPSLPLL